MNFGAAFALTFFYLSPTWAIECAPRGFSSQEVHDFPGSGYWMQAAGECRITYTGTGGGVSHLYNLCTRRSEPITVGVDAYGLPRGDIYVQPLDRGIGFFKMKDVLEKGPNAEAFFKDEKLQGNYESVGQLPGSTDARRRIRIAMGNETTQFRDYIVSEAGVQPTGPVRKACEGWFAGMQEIEQKKAELTPEVPVLSRNGQMIAGRRYLSRETLILKMEGTKGKCREIRRIPSETGKVNFSFDNKSVAFIENVNGRGPGRVVEMDLATGKRRTLTLPGEDVMYMAYRPDGTLMYTRRNQRSGEDKSELVILNRESLTPAKSQELAIQRVGHLWAKKCGRSLDNEFAQAVGLRLKGSDCQQLVAGQNDLTSVCSGLESSKPEEKSVRSRIQK